MTVNASEARAKFFPLIKQVNDDHAPVRISSRGGDVVLMSADDFDSWQETLYLMRTPANAARLLEAVERDRAGETGTTTSLDELERLSGDA